MLKLLQLGTYLVAYWPLRWLLRPTVRGVSFVPPHAKQGLLIAANHPARLDPIVLALLPWSAVTRIIPVYYPTAEKYYRHWWLQPLIRLFGAYPIREQAWTLGAYLSDSAAKLRSGGTVMLFPEGRLNPTGATLPARAGVAMLAAATGAPVLPLHITGMERLSLTNLLRRRVAVSLTIGPLINAPREDITVERGRKNAEHIVTTIRSLT